MRYIFWGLLFPAALTANILAVIFILCVKTVALIKHLFDLPIEVMNAVDVILEKLGKKEEDANI
jgi:hypothetical protein